MKTTHFVLVDHKSGADWRDFAMVAHALERQVNRDFALAPPLGYGIGCQVRVGSLSRPPIAGEIVLGLFAEPDQAGALGYHDVTPAGLPLIKVFPLLDAGDHVHWSVTASHEVLEVLGDPELALCAQAPDGTFWARETADAVEADHYEIDGVMVSNFVLPPYFEPPSNLFGVKLDFMGLVERPFEIRPGGYNQYWGPRGWTMVERSMRAGRRQMLGRSARRAQRARPGNAVVEYAGTLDRVIDGDTCVLLLSRSFDIDMGFGEHDKITRSQEQRVRLARINAPEMSTPKGPAAQNELLRLLQLGPIRVSSHGLDKYGRLLAELFVTPLPGPEFNVSDALLTKGYARPYGEAP